MPSETEAMAFVEAAVALAAERGWLQRDESGRVALTDAAREIAQTLGPSLH
jgi:hypothetical protein